MASISKLADLLRNEQAKVVKMNESKILLYRSRSGIVTGDLGSCHVVVLQSPIAVLLSHISPRADDKQPLHVSGDQHVDSKLNEALELYTKWRSWFPQGSSAWGIYAWYDNKIALGDQRTIIERKLASTGLPVLDRYYKVPRSDDSPGRGTIVCGWMEGDKICRLYVEDNLQNEITVHQAHGDLATTLANAMRKKAEASKPSSSAVVSTSTASTQAPRPQASGAQSTGRAAGAAAMTILGRFGIDAARARVFLQNRFREMQENPALSGDSDQAAVAAACRTVMDRSPQTMTLDQAKDLLRRQMAAQNSGTASGAGPSSSRSKPNKEESDDDESSEQDDSD